MGSVITFDHGRRLIPTLVDELARTDPNRVVYSVASSADISQGFRVVSAKNFGDAVNKTAWWLEGLVGKSTSFETIAYIGPHDLRYFLLILASIKVGYKMLLLSPNNSKEGAAACINSTQCRLWVHPQGRSQSPLLRELQAMGHDIRVLGLPDCLELLDAKGTEHYPYTRTFEHAKSEPFCVLHSSGSTGLPKTILVTHGLMATQDAMKHPDLRTMEGSHSHLTPYADLFYRDARIYSPNSLLHATAILINLAFTYFFETHCIFGPVDVDPSVELFSSMMDHAKLDIFFGLPQYINALAQEPEVLRKFKSLKFIGTAGGPMSPESGAIVNKVVRCFNMTGTSEGMFSPDLLVDQEDFLYFAWHQCGGYDFRETEQPGVFEHWIVRDPKLSLWQGIFYTFPQLDEVNIKDLYVQHPTKKGYWLYYGRNDDIVALDDGIKISASDVQATIADHPAIKGCLMLGAGRPLPSVLVELHEPVPQDPGKLQGLLESIHVQVQKADDSCLYKGYFRKDCVLLADPERPFVRTDKLTVKRRETLALYEKDIEEFYEQREMDTIFISAKE